MIISVDFDGTLALGNKSHITLAEPNYELIDRLVKLKSSINPHIKIVTARGAKSGLSNSQKIEKYKGLIEEFCRMYTVPYDEISFNKEYADLYIDDMTINQFEEFDSLNSRFTSNKILFTEKTVIKKCRTSLFEKNWYEVAKLFFNVPEVLFANDETIITQRILNHIKPQTEDVILTIKEFKKHKIKNYDFKTYVKNIKIDSLSTEKVKDIINYLPSHDSTFFHGDLSSENILKKVDKIYLIDPNYKNIFGSYLTDAGKYFFSLVAYENNFFEAQKVVEAFGEDVIKFAVAEGLRVCKYRREYISIVNNIADLIK